MIINEQLSRKIAEDSNIISNDCFKNAWVAMLKTKKLQNSTYCLGYYETRSTNKLFQHAWIISDKKIIDPTIFAENSEPDFLDDINYFAIFSLSYDEIHNIYFDKGKGIREPFGLDIYIKLFPEKKSIYEQKKKKLIDNGYEFYNQEYAEFLLPLIEKNKKLETLSEAIDKYSKKHPNIDHKELDAIIPHLQDDKSISHNMWELVTSIIENFYSKEDSRNEKVDEFDVWLINNYTIEDEI